MILGPRNQNSSFPFSHSSSLLIEASELRLQCSDHLNGAPRRIINCRRNSSRASLLLTEEGPNSGGRAGQTLTVVAVPGNAGEAVPSGGK